MTESSDTLETSAPALFGRRVAAVIRRLPAAGVAALVTVSLVGAGCTSARNALGTNSSPCYLALPVAKQAVHDRGTFGGVRLVTAKQLATRTHKLKELTQRAGGKLTDICVIDYRGTYRLDQVEDPVGRAPAGGTGRYAIVVVSRSTDKLIGTFVRRTLPVRFRHVALGNVDVRTNAPRTTHSHAQPRTATHSHAQPRTATHSHAQPRTATHTRG